jgi:putative ABC transport system permease protein
LGTNGFYAQQLADRGAHFLTIIAALQPGVGVAQANAQLRVLSQNLRQQHMDIMRFVDGFVAVPLQEVYTEDVRGGLIVLLVAVAFILLIACANIANLLLSRATVRQPAIALRTALGAGRACIVRQLLTESAVLAIAGGMLGILLTKASFTFLKVLIPEDLSRTASLTFNLSVLGFAILISLASTFLFGLTPALRISRTDVNESLKGGARAGSSPRTKSLGDLLVAGEVALSVVLLVGSGLLLNLANLRAVDPGFRSDHVLTAQNDVPDAVTKAIPNRPRKRFRSAHSYRNERQRNDPSSGRAPFCILPESRPV